MPCHSAAGIGLNFRGLCAVWLRAVEWLPLFERARAEEPESVLLAVPPLAATPGLSAVGYCARASLNAFVAAVRVAVLPEGLVVLLA